MTFTTYIPSNFQSLQSVSFFNVTVTIFVILILFIAGYYVIFESDKSKIPESF